MRISGYFLILLARKPGTVHPEKGTRSSSTDLQQRYAPTTEHFNKFRERHSLYLNVIRKGSAMKEALWAPTYGQRDVNFTLWAEELARCQAWKWAKSLFKIRGNIWENEATFF